MAVLFNPTELVRLKKELLVTKTRLVSARNDYQRVQSLIEAEKMKLSYQSGQIIPKESERLQAQENEAFNSVHDTPDDILRKERTAKFNNDNRLRKFRNWVILNGLFLENHTEDLRKKLIELNGSDLDDEMSRLFNSLVVEDEPLKGCLEGMLLIKSLDKFIRRYIEISFDENEAEVVKKTKAAIRKRLCVEERSLYFKNGKQHRVAIIDMNI